MMLLQKWKKNLIKGRKIKMKIQTIINKPYIIYIIKDTKAGRQFKGIAKCMPDDIWNEEKGLKIAKLRAEIRRLEWKQNNLVSSIHFIDRVLCNEISQLEKRICDLFEGSSNKYEELESLISEEIEECQG
jgi:uncharacterized coiled-coil DUF342 family protein